MGQLLNVWSDRFKESLSFFFRVKISVFKSGEFQFWNKFEIWTKWFIKDLLYWEIEVGVKTPKTESGQLFIDSKIREKPVT